LKTWGDNARAVDSVTAVHRLFEGQAKAQPQATAVVFGAESLSYTELNAQANRLAHRLMALGVKPESRVGIAMERSPQMVVALLGILKAGGAYVPLDPAYPQERLAYMVADSGIELLLTHSALGGHIPGSQGFDVLELDRLQLQDEPAHDPQVAVHADNLAYVIYTSGSTGKPKGVEVLHRAIVRLVGNADYARLDSSVRMLQFAPLAFDASTFEVWGSLCNGGVLVQAPAARPSFDELAEVIEREHVTTAWLTAALFNQMLESHPQALGGLRQLLSGGEAMSAHHARQALERFGQSELVNGYGPTECTTFAVCHAVRTADVQRDSVPLGGPIVGTTCHVLDASLHPVPQGVVGELYLGGAGLARGYLKRAGLTAERFVATEGGQRLYRTGDLVRWNNEGQLEYLGRIDHQVKVRGFRIELGEIEAQLLAQESVREAVVVANQGPAGARLVGYVSGQEIDTAVLRARLAEALPDYMVPGALVVLDALPLNANGKVDRKALPDAQFGGAQEYEAPQGEVEEALSQIWSQVLGVQRVGRNDNFFELGGHSIAVLRMQTRLQKQFSVQLPLRTYFENPTLVAIGAILQAESRTAQNDEADELGQMAALLEMLED
jgi:amino acid adenylation domain-containing protein